jgi:cysteinyl-tRNA synthetase
LSVVAELGRVGNELAQRATKHEGDKRTQATTRALAAAAVEALDACCRPMGLMQASTEDFFSRTRARRLQVRGLDAAAIDAKVKERTSARTAKDFARADAIRAELEAQGIELQDVLGGGPTKWTLRI